MTASPPSNRAQAQGSSGKETPQHPLIIVDDDEVIRTVGHRVLQGLGWEVHQAADGVAGLELIQAQPAGVVVLADIEMPRMTGLEMLRRAEATHHQAMILTAHASTQNVIQAFAVGAVDFSVKPVSDWPSMHQVLLKLDRNLTREESQRNELRNLQAQADWQYWKAMFLSGGAKTEMHRVLDAMHVQLNQDVNYVQLIDALKASAGSGDTVTMGRDLFEVLTAALKPVARLADGIGIAQTVMHKDLGLSNLPLPEFKAWLQELLDVRIAPLAKRRDHRIETWIDEASFDATRHLHLDKDLFATALIEVLTNAMKYSSARDLIQFNVQASSDHLMHILVTNPARATTRGRDGTLLQGVPRDIEELAFRFFIRFSIETQHGYDERWPMGLGLPLVRQVIEKHGGKIMLRNEHWHLTKGASAAPEILVSCRIELPTHALPIAEVPVSLADDLELF